MTDLRSQTEAYRFYFETSRPAWFLDPVRSGGGKFCNVGVHRIAAVRCLLGDELSEVAVTASVHVGPAPYTVEAATMAMVSYAGGSAMTFEEGGHHRPPQGVAQGLRLVFERGQLGVGTDHVWISDMDGRVTRHACVVPPPGGPYAPLYTELAQAVAGLPHVPTLLWGARDVRVALAAYASAREGRQVDLRVPEWDLGLSQ